MSARGEVAGVFEGEVDDIGFVFLDTPGPDPMTDGLSTAVSGNGCVALWARYNGSTDLNNNVPQFIDAYTLVNARLTWQNEDKDLSVSLEGTNLFDKYYYVTLFDLRAAGAGLDKAQPGRPHQPRGSVSWNRSLSV